MVGFPDVEKFIQTSETLSPATIGKLRDGQCEENTTENGISGCT